VKGEILYLAILVLLIAMAIIVHDAVVALRRRRERERLLAELYRLNFYGQEPTHVPPKVQNGGE
jgi:hypothetical protein